MTHPKMAVSYLVVLVALTAGACGETGMTFDLNQVTVDTSLDRLIINAGETVKVTCIVTDVDGREVKTDTAFDVTPGVGVVVDGAKVTPSKTGEYTITCMLPDETKVDETPETLLVTIDNIVAIETELDKNEAKAGEDVAVACTVKNADGDVVDWDAEALVTPEDGLEIDGLTLKTKTMGEFEVACKAVDLPIRDDTPEPLIVSAGDPVLVRATIKEDEVEAGTEVPVFCTVEDELGNALEYETVVDPQEGIEIDGTTIVPALAGEYDIFCSAAEDLGELEQISDHLIVTAGPISSLVLVPKPKKKAYKVGDKVEILAHAADSMGNPVEENVEAVITAPEGMKEAGEKWEFTEEGTFTFTGHLAADETIAGEVTLICDETGPELTLFKPERGATLTDDVMVDVEGHATDLLSDTIELEINNTSVPVDEDGNFFHVVEAAHGMNILTVEATDGFGQTTKIVQSFYYSTEYMDYSTGNADDVLLDEALIIYLGQNFLDDGDHDKANIDDLATLVEVLLDGLDLGAILPPDVAVLDQEMPGLVNVPLINQMGFELSLVGDLSIKLYIEDLSFAEPYVAIDTRDGGIDMTISFMGPEENPGIYVQTVVELSFGLTVESKFGGNDLVSVGINPGVAVQTSAAIETLLVETSFDINKNAGEELDITVADLNVVPSGFHIELIKEDTKLILGAIDVNGVGVVDLGAIDLGQLGFLQTINQFLDENVIGPVLDFVVPGLLDLIEPMIEDQVTKMLGDLLNQFEFEIPIPIPQLPGSEQAIEISFKTNLSSVHFNQDGGELGLGAGFMAPKGVEREVLGSLMRAGCGGDFIGKPEFDSAEKFMFAATLDMVNELLFSLWWGGGLALALDESVLGGLSFVEFGITDLSVETVFWLPRILDDCTAKGMVEVQIGDLLITPSFKMMGAPVTIGMFVSAALDAVITGDGSEIALQINGITDIGTEVVSIEGSLGAFEGMFDIEQLIEGVLVPMIVEQVANLSLGSFPIPEIDLSSLLPGIPPGTTLSLGNLVIEMNMGYLVFGGELM